MIESSALAWALNKLEGFNTAITLADLSQYDCPIVFTNDAFTKLTGYSHEEIVGKNCRFLQGSDTNVESVNRISEGLINRESIFCLLTNYKKSGDKFNNLLMLTPVRAPKVQDLYIGCQYDFPCDSYPIGLEKHISDMVDLENVLSKASTMTESMIIRSIKARTDAVNLIVRNHLASQGSEVFSF